MATMREIRQAIQDDFETRNPDVMSLEVRFSHARVCLNEAIEIAFRLEGELIVNDSPETIEELVEQFDQWSDAWVDLMLGR